MHSSNGIIGGSCRGPSSAASWPVHANGQFIKAANARCPARAARREHNNPLSREVPALPCSSNHQQPGRALAAASCNAGTSCRCCSSAGTSTSSSGSSSSSSNSSSSSSSSSSSHAPAWPWHGRMSGHRKASQRHIPKATVGSSGQQSDAGMANLFMAYALQMQQALAQQQQAQQQRQALPGANVLLKDVTFHPPGTEQPLLDRVNMSIGSNKLGLLIGRSGSGKTTLLQLLAGLTDQTSGQVFMSREPLPQLGGSAGSNGSGGAGSGGGSSSSSSVSGSGSSNGAGAGVVLPEPAQIEDRMKQVGLVFQFPERHFLGDNLMSELTFSWPRTAEHWAERTALAARLQTVVEAVGMRDIPFDIAPSELSGGQQRRLALALQLVRQPSLLLLDEPLAGLDWKARREVIALLARIKQECTLLVVSHDLREIQPLVDCAWRMQMGGTLEALPWPPESVSDLED